MRIDRLALIGVALVLGLALLFNRPGPGLLNYEVDGTVAYLNGTSDGRSERLIRHMVRDHPEVETLVFERMPGTRDVTSNYLLARTIREAGLNTQLTANSRIASGAVDLFLAGVEREVDCGAMIGVHAWGSSGFDAQDVSWDTHRGYSRNFLSDMGIDPDFYDFRTNAAGTDDIHWMSVEEINAWEIATEPVVCESR